MRKEYEFHFIVCDCVDQELFYRQCSAIEKHIPDLTKEPLLEDVDGSLQQCYHHPRGDIFVENDYVYNELYVNAEFNLFPYFKQDLGE